jgi:hypothetical protein
MQAIRRVKLKSCLRKPQLETGNVKIDHLLSRSKKEKAQSLGQKSNAGEKSEGGINKNG